jgi:hypothetical protein
MVGKKKKDNMEQTRQDRSKARKIIASVLKLAYYKTIFYSQKQ